MRTRLELQTAPGSAIGTVGRLTAEWEKFAREVESRINPTKDQLVLWRLIYNWHQETADEFEYSEMPPIPLLFGKVVLVCSDTLWELKQCPYTFEFNCCGLVVYTEGGNISCIADELMPEEIAKYLRTEKVAISK